MRDFIVNNFVWLFSVVYFLGAVTYYELIYSTIYERDFSEVRFSDIYNDSIYIVLWLPEIALMIVRLLIATALYLPIKILVLLNKKKKK